MVTFDPTDIEQDVSIPILSDGIVESAEEFFGQLSLVEGERRRVRLGQINSTTITILDSDGGSVANVVRVARGWGGGGRLSFVAIQLVYLLEFRTFAVIIILLPLQFLSYNCPAPYPLLPVLLHPQWLCSSWPSRVTLCVKMSELPI